MVTHQVLAQRRSLELEIDECTLVAGNEKQAQDQDRQRGASKPQRKPGHGVLQVRISQDVLHDEGARDHGNHGNALDGFDHAPLPSREHRPQEVKRLIESPGPEKNPGRSHYQERAQGEKSARGEEMRETKPSAGSPEESFDDQIRSVQPSPDEKVPGGPVPETSEEHGEHHIEVGP